MGKKMSLILDHINGINNDNRIENLRIVCPNCNATLDTHCRGNKKSNEKNKKYCECGKEIFKSSIKCKKCDSIKQRKVERPSLEQLKEDIKNSIKRVFSISLNFYLIERLVKKFVQRKKITIPSLRVNKSQCVHV
jgi:hypothetical protein